jgi:hypothetical protein
MPPILPAGSAGVAGSWPVRGRFVAAANIDVNVEGSVFSQHDGRQPDPDL